MSCIESGWWRWGFVDLVCELVRALNLLIEPGVLPAMPLNQNMDQTSPWSRSRWLVFRCNREFGWLWACWGWKWNLSAGCTEVSFLLLLCRWPHFPPLCADQVVLLYNYRSWSWRTAGWVCISGGRVVMMKVVSYSSHGGGAEGLQVHEKILLAYCYGTNL